jgi:hypothetical protein
LREKHDANYENKIILSVENKIKSGHYKIFDKARVIKKERFPELVSNGQTEDDNCLIIANNEGDAIVITAEFERILLNAIKNRT